MTSILDSSPYPWSRPEARQLHVELTRAFPSGQIAVRLAASAGLDQFALFAEQAPTLVWQDVLNAAGPAGLTRALAQVAHDQLNPSAPLRPFLADLLADRTVATSGERIGGAGQPDFLTGDDTVLEPETLLYQDDLTIEFGRVRALIMTLDRLLAVGPSVCKVTADFGGNTQFGTAFRIAPDLLLTNWHVLHRRSDGAPAVAVRAEFRFEDDGSGGGLASTPVPCDAGSIVADREHDWAVMRATEPLRDEWPILPLDATVTPAPGDSAFVIQHPLGGRKRVAIVRNQVSFVDDRIVHYLTDTQVGSSGSPVLDAAGRLIALHHAGGRPQDVLGKPPVLKNEGIRIPQIITGLSGHGIALDQP